MEHAPCLRIKKVWHVSKTVNWLVTGRNQFAPKCSDGMKATEDSLGSLGCELGKVTTGKHGKRKKGQNTSNKHQRALDDKARIEHNRMLIRKQKELATRRNYLRKQHQIKTGALKKMQETDRMARGDTLAYRLAARKSFLTLQIRLKQAHRDLLRSLRHHVSTEMSGGSIALNRDKLDDDNFLEESKEPAMTKSNEYSEDSTTEHKTNLSSDNEKIMFDQSSVENQPNTKCTEKLHGYSTKDLIGAYERFIQLPLSPYLLVVNSDTVYDIIRSFRCVTTVEIRDIQIQVLNRIQSMFLLYDDDDFITMFTEKAIWHKRYHHDRLLQLDFIHDTEAQTECNDEDDSDITADTDTAIAVVPENTHSQSGHYLAHLQESNGDEKLELSCGIKRSGDDSLIKIKSDVKENTKNTNQLKKGENNSELESLADEVAVPKVLGDITRSITQHSVQVVPGHTNTGSCNESFEQTAMNNSPDCNDASFFPSEEVNLYANNCQQMNSEDSLEIIKALTAPEE